jgi:hypothetical protein
MSNPSVPLSVDAQAHPDAPVTLAQLNSFLNSFAQQQSQMLQDQVQHLQATQFHRNSAAPSAANSAASSAVGPTGAVSLGPGRVKLSAPSNFTGARNANVDSWLFEVTQYLTLSGVVDEVSRVKYAATYLKDAALTWWRGRSTEDDGITHSWNLFETALKERFQPLAASRTARAQLRTLHQGHMSVSDFCNRFYNLVQLIPDMGNEEQLEKFTSGLRRDLAEKVEIREPKNLHEAMTLATKMELLSRNHRSTDRSSYLPLSYSFRSNPSSTHPASSSSSSSSSSNAMELGNLNAALDEIKKEEEQEDVLDSEYQRYLEEGDDYEPNYEIWQQEESQEHEEEETGVEQLQAMQQRRGPRAPYVPPEEFRRCMRDGLCLKCKKPGHIHRNCPNSNSSSSSSRPPHHVGHRQNSSSRFHRNF